MTLSLRSGFLRKPKYCTHSRAWWNFGDQDDEVRERPDYLFAATRRPISTRGEHPDLSVTIVLM